MTTPSLGPCCICSGTKGVCVLISLDGLCPMAGRGWGCVVCGLPPDGAVAVICDVCERRYGDAVPKVLQFFCTGYPGEDGRTPISHLRGRYRHQVSRHKRDMDWRNGG